MKYKLLSVVLLVVLVFSPIYSIPFVSAQAKQAKWTVMVYVAANNNLEPNSMVG